MSDPPSGGGPRQNLDWPVTALHDQALAVPPHHGAGWRWLLLRGPVRYQAGLGNLQRLAVDLAERPGRDVAPSDPAADLVVHRPRRLPPVDDSPRLLEQSSFGGLAFV